MRKVKLTKESTKDILETLLKRSPNNYGKYEDAVANILAKVKAEGDTALFAFTREFDKVEVTKDTIRVTPEEIEEAYKLVDPSLIDVIKKALVNIRSYHEKQLQNSWFTSTTDGTMLGQKVTALNCVGVYVPGGKAVYPYRRLCAGGGLSLLCHLFRPAAGPYRLGAQPGGRRSGAGSPGHSRRSGGILRRHAPRPSLCRGPAL